MTVRVFKRRKNKFIIASFMILLVGLACLVLAFGLSDGWDAVVSWFTSKWAILLYIFVGVYVLVILWFILAERINKL